MKVESCCFNNSKTSFRIYTENHSFLVYKSGEGVSFVMKKNLFFLSVIIVLMIGIVGCSNGNSTNVMDDSNTETKDTSNEETETVEAAPEEQSDERIVATTVAITEFMDVLEIDLVGVPSSYKDLPERYADATEIGNPMWPDMEVLMSLQPTNVLTVTTLKEDLEADFAKINAPATFLNLESVTSMLEEIEQLGEQYNRTEKATQFVNDYKEQIAMIEEKVSNQEKPKVLILMGIPGSYIVGTEHSYIGDLVKRAGGENAVTGRDEEYISANTEYLQQLEPDVILRAAHGAPTEVVKMFDKEFAENNIWKHFKAVQNDRVYDLEETRFGTTANLAAIDALEELITILHPDL